jgi:hypothetical protein
MAVIGSYSVMSVPGFSQSTLSYRYDDVDDLLIKLLDNSSNLIDPLDIRDPVYTLWKKIEDVELIAASANAGSSLFTLATPSTVTVGGIGIGSTFSSSTVTNLLEQMLFPHVSPVPQLTITTPTLINQEYRSIPASVTVGLSFSVTKRNYNISQIKFNNTNYTTGFPWTSDVSGTVISTSFPQISGFHPSNPGASYEQVFTMSVSDDGNNGLLPIKTSIATASIIWQNRVYCDSPILSGGITFNLNPTEGNPASQSQVASLVTDTVIQGLSSSLSTVKEHTFYQVGSNNRHVVLAWPSSMVGASTPTFKVNGVVNNAFTRLRNGQPFQSLLGFTTNYEVWISNTPQNSPIDITIS